MRKRQIGGSGREFLGTSGVAISARHRAGFTLLELCVVLAIMAIMAGFALPKFRDISREEQLWSVVREIRSAALACRRLAVVGGGPHVVLIDSSRVRVTSWPDSAPSQSASLTRLRGDVKIETWDPRQRRWQPARIEWVFQPSGICDPLSLRLRSSFGWIEQKFNPLTATVDEEAWSFQ